MKVLVTGAFGWTARAVHLALGNSGHEIIAFDNGSACSEEALELAAIFRGDVRDPIEFSRAIDGADAAVHMAVLTGEGAYEVAEPAFAVNVLGTYNLFDAARRHGLQRVVLISEASVHLPPGPGPNQWRSDPGDDHLYDLTKLLQEEIARDYSDTYGIPVVALRIGHVVDGKTRLDPHGRALAELDYCRGGWVCRYEVATAVTRALELNAEGYRTYNVIGSKDAREPYDIERTERELGMTFDQRFEGYDMR